MKRLNFDEAGIIIAAECIRAGGVVVLPTDTVYGVACRIRDERALERIRAMKCREATKPFQVLAASVDAVWADGALRTAKAERLAQLWPGALTLVLPTSDGRVEGYRVPNEPQLQRLIAQCGGLIRCTSVNLSGEPPAKNADAAATTLPDADILLDGGDAQLGIASTVVRLTPDDRVEVLRQGAVVIDGL